MSSLQKSLFRFSTVLIGLFFFVVVVAIELYELFDILEIHCWSHCLQIYFLSLHVVFSFCSVAIS